jgi:hypothetical protein
MRLRDERPPPPDASALFMGYVLVLHH